MSGHSERLIGQESQHRNRCCRYCRHWQAPAATLLAAFDAFREGITRRPVKQPIGHCDQVLMTEGGPVSFSTTAPGFTCLNFREYVMKTIAVGDGMVTLYEDDRIVWQGREADIPDAYR